MDEVAYKKVNANSNKYIIKAVFNLQGHIHVSRRRFA